MDISKSTSVTRESSIDPEEPTRNKSRNSRSIRKSNGSRGFNKRTQKNKVVKVTNKSVKTNKSRNKNNGKEQMRIVKENAARVVYQQEETPREEIPYTEFLPDLKLDEQLDIIHSYSDITDNNVHMMSQELSQLPNTAALPNQNEYNEFKLVQGVGILSDHQDNLSYIKENSSSGTTPHEDMDEDTVQDDEQDRHSDIDQAIDIQTEIINEPMDLEYSTPATSETATVAIDSLVIMETVSESIPKEPPIHSYRRINCKKFEKEPFVRPEGHYIRHVELTEKDLVEIVEYDMDEQDDLWLKAFNQERKKEDLGELTADVFEALIDRLEKEWFDLTKNLPKGQGEKENPEDSTCAICDDGECENCNAIVFCDGCNLAVHQDCYGIPYIPEGQWLCRKCIVSPETPVVYISKRGAFKKTNTNRWAHLLCALWIPEVGLSNPVYMEPIDNIEGIPRGRWKLKCYICEKKMGACIQCQNTHCCTAFHVTCARKAKLCMRMKFPDPNSDANQMKAYCDKHTPRDYREQIDVAQTVAKAQSLLIDPVPVAKKLSRKTRKRKESDSASYPRKTIKVNPQESEKRLSNKSIESSKSARAYNRSYMETAIVAPTIITDRLLPVLSMHKGQLRKKPELIATICKYWSLKRESRRGAPLLKRLHLEPWTASASAHKQSEEEKMAKYAAMLDLRKDLEKVRMLIDLVHRREKEKLKRNRLQVKYLETIIFPLDYIIGPVLDTISSLDKNEIFAKPVSLEEVPDYLTHIKHPMDFGTIRKKIENHEYSLGSGMQGFKDDVELTLQNAMTYNTSNTIYYRVAKKIRQQFQTIAAQMEKDYTELQIDPSKGILNVEIHPEIFTYNDKPLKFEKEVKSTSRSNRIANSKHQNHDVLSRHLLKNRETRSTIRKKNAKDKKKLNTNVAINRKPRAPKGWVYLTDEEGGEEKEEHTPIVVENSNQNPTDIDEDKATISSRTRSRKDGSANPLKVENEKGGSTTKLSKSQIERPTRGTKRKIEKSTKADRADNYEIVDMTPDNSTNETTALKEQIQLQLLKAKEEAEKPAATRTRARSQKKNEDLIQNDSIKKSHSSAAESNSEIVQSNRSTTSGELSNVPYGSLVWAKMQGFPWYPAEVADPNGPEVTEAIRSDKKEVILIGDEQTDLAKLRDKTMSPTMKKEVPKAYEAACMSQGIEPVVLQQLSVVPLKKHNRK
ncbi:13366_t:CDS:10 [Dentiscutata heterogama]|uniref:13366_t:CDS:1 n=1 Tax=Dentiscutata heterogama TaxID=1316150 RepID=A0ACA9LTB8_9GLOM|nr:13366_t:CDS:10 [Dentiscutata heterogama]